MKEVLLTAVAMMALTVPALASGTHGGGHGDEMELGRPGEDQHVTRTIEVSILETDDGEMLYEPRRLDFEPGETVKLIITNNGELEHEFVMDTIAKNVKHKEAMAKMDMEHDDPNSVRLDPGASAEIIWTFTNEGSFEFACLIPGHYESGMHGALDVKKLGS